MFYNEAPPNDSLCDINFLAKKMYTGLFVWFHVKFSCILLGQGTNPLLLDDFNPYCVDSYIICWISLSIVVGQDTCVLSVEFASSLPVFFILCVLETARSIIKFSLAWFIH